MKHRLYFLDPQWISRAPFENFADIKHFPDFEELLIVTGATGTMPIYEYECTSCQNVFELFQSITDSPLTTCPDCAGSVKKLMSMSSFQLKGGGWYADGYSSKACNSSGAAATSSPETSGQEKVEKTTSSSVDASAAPKSKEKCSATT